MRFKLPREAYIPKGATKIADKASDGVAYIYTNSKGAPAAAVFHGAQAKPDWQFYFRNEAAREKRIREYFEGRQARGKLMQERRDERKAFVHNVKVGDIFRTSWGYDQTNVEFFEVIEVRGKHCIIREIAQATRHAGSGADYSVPQSGAFLEPRFEGDERGKPMRKLIQQSGSNGCSLTIDECRTAWPWGERDAVTGTVIGKPVYSTAAGWGH